MQVDFVKECGSDNVCLSNLQFEVTLDQTKDGDQYILRDGEFSRADLKFTVTNLGEAAYLTQVYIQKPPNLDYQGVSGAGQVPSGRMGWALGFWVGGWVSQSINVLFFVCSHQGDIRHAHKKIYIYNIYH